MTQQSHSWAHTQQKSKLKKETCTPMFIATLFTIAGHGSNLYVQQESDE